jgi:hypothetical protein
MRPYTDDEWETLPHVIWTSDEEWDPTVLDHEIADDETWYNAVSDLQEGLMHRPFDEYGRYREREAELHCVNTSQHSEDINDVINCVTLAHATRQQPHKPDYEALRPLFAWIPAINVEHTFHATTQYARATVGTTLKHAYKTPFPACNVRPRNEAVATDTVYSDVPAVDCGHTSAQIFVGRGSLVTDIVGMSTDKQFVNTLEDNIRYWGAMDKLISDRAQLEISNRAKDLLRAMAIEDWQSEPGYQHQNFAEHRYNTLKSTSNTVISRFGAPDYTWLLSLMYVCYILNHTATESLGWRTPLEKLNGQTPDISALITYHFWEPVYYMIEDASFPSEPTERTGHFVGISEHVGNAMTYKILTNDTNKIIHRSSIQTGLKPHERNMRANAIVGEMDTHNTKCVINLSTIMGRTIAPAPCLRSIQPIL